jgi:hypothetical protein
MMRALAALLLAAAAAANADVSPSGECGAPVGARDADELAELEGELSRVELLQQKKRLQSPVEPAAGEAAKPSTGTSEVDREHEAAAAWLRSIYEGKLPPASYDEVVAKFLPVAATKSNATSEDLVAVMRSSDKNQDGKLDAEDLRRIFEPKVVTAEEGPASASVEPALGGHNASRLQTKDWIAVGLGSSWTWAWDAPAYFLPRIEYDDGLTVIQCWAVTFLLPGTGSCYGYFYSNGDTAGSDSLCRCLPWSALHENGIAWAWYQSSVGNHIYYGYGR